MRFIRLDRFGLPEENLVYAVGSALIDLNQRSQGGNPPYLQMSGMVQKCEKQHFCDRPPRGLRHGRLGPIPAFSIGAQSPPGCTTKSSMTQRTPGVASTATRATFLSVSESTAPQRWTVPSWTKTLGSKRLVLGACCNRANTIGHLEK